MSQKTSIDENMEEVLVHSWLAEAHRQDQGEERTADFAADEQALIPELAKAFEIERGEVAYYYQSYEALQTGRDEGMLAARRGEKRLPDQRANTQYYKATALTHLVNLLAAKDELMDELGEVGQAYALRHGLMATDEGLAKRLGAIARIEAADLGAVFGWPSDDRVYQDTTPQATYMAHFVAFQEVVDTDIAVGILELSDESPQARQILYRWLRLAAQQDISRLDKRARQTHRFVQDHIRELLVATTASVGYDPRTPEAFETPPKLVCKRKTRFFHPRNPDVEVKIVDDPSDVGAFAKTGGGAVLHATYDSELKRCVTEHQGKTDIFEPLVKQGDPIGFPVDAFIAQHTEAALAREQQLFDAVGALIGGGAVPAPLEGSYELGVLFKLKGAYDIARESDAEEGDGMDIEGKFSGNEIALFRKAFELAGFSSRCSDLIMDIQRDEHHEIRGASFNHMTAIYEGPAYQAWTKSPEADQWIKAYRPYKTRRRLTTRVMTAFKK